MKIELFNRTLKYSNVARIKVIDNILDIFNSNLMYGELDIIEDFDKYIRHLIMKKCIVCQIDTDKEPLVISKYQFKDIMSIYGLNEYSNAYYSQLIPIINSNNWKIQLNYREYFKSISINIEKEEFSIRDLKLLKFSKSYRIRGNVGLIGFYDPIKNIIKLFVEPLNVKEKYKIAEIIESSEVYKKYQEYINKNMTSEISTGIEAEFLLADENKNVIRADLALRRILEKFHVSEKSLKELEDRSTSNQLFTDSCRMGTDGRRILGEIRSDVYKINIKNRQNIDIQIRKLSKEINKKLIEFTNLNKVDLYLGGGFENESTGVHIHFGHPLKLIDHNLINLINKTIVLPLQGMRGGQRPDMINPPDRIDRSNLSPNPHGQIKWLIQKDIENISATTERNSYSNMVRMKPWGWELRTPPSFSVNTIFTYNVLRSVFRLWELAYKNFDFPSLSSHNLISLIFKDYTPYWEFYFMSKYISFEKPFQFFLDSYKNIKFIGFENYEDEKAKKVKKSFGEIENLPYIKKELNDYVTEKTFFKLEYNPIRKLLLVPKFKRMSAEFMREIYKLNIEIKSFKLKNHPNNSFKIIGYGFKESEIKNICKLCLLLQGEL